MAEERPPAIDLTWILQLLTVKLPDDATMDGSTTRTIAREVVGDVVRAYEAKITSGELLTKEEHERLLKEAEDRASFRWSE